MHKPLICVVNDDTVFLALMHELLTEEGYAVTTHTDADKSYDEIKRKQPNPHHPGHPGWE
jgi:CheY-like chemotaxis protein